MSKEIVDYFRGECRYLKEYLRRYKYYQRKYEELDYNLLNLHPASTDRVTSTTSYSMKMFDYETATDREDCEKLVALYAEKIKSVNKGIHCLPRWVRPDIIRAYVMELPMKQIAESSNKDVFWLQKEFRKAMSDSLTDKWMYRDRKIKEKISDVESSTSRNITYKY